MILVFVLDPSVYCIKKITRYKLLKKTLLLTFCVVDMLIIVTELDKLLQIGPLQLSIAVSGWYLLSRYDSHGNLKMSQTAPHLKVISLATLDMITPHQCQLHCTPIFLLKKLLVEKAPFHTFALLCSLLFFKGWVLQKNSFIVPDWAKYIVGKPSKLLVRTKKWFNISNSQLLGLKIRPKARMLDSNHPRGAPKPECQRHNGPRV